MICIQRASAVPAATVPNAPPTNIVLTPLSSSTIQVSFGPPPSTNRNGDILSYSINYTGSPFDTSTVTLNVPGSTDPEESYSEVINFLQEFNTYDVTLAAVNAQGVGVESTPQLVQTFADVPLAAQDLMLSVLSATSIQVDFSPPLPEEQNGLITSYIIQYIGLNVDTMQDDDTTSITDTTYPASDQISYILTQLEEFEDYTITVFPVNSAGISFDPLSESAITLSAVPDSAPINVNIIPDQRSLTVTWDPPPAISQNGQISNYLIAITGDPFPFTETSPIIITASGSYPDTQQYSEDITGLEEYNSYDISIAASNMIGDGPFSPVSTQMTLEAVPDAPPTNIVLMALSSTTMQVSFGPPPSANRNGDILSYKIYYTGSPFDTCRVTLNVTGSIDPEESYLEDINFLQEFNTYDVTLAAVNAQGVGVASAPLSAQTFADVPLAAQDLMLSVLSATSIQVDFSPPLPEEQNGLITSYTIQYIGLYVDTVQDEVITSITNTNYPASDQISYILTQLEEFEDYTITVFPVNSAGISFDPLSELATTLSAVPDSAPIIDNIIQNQRSLTVTWSPPPSITQNGQLFDYLIVITGDPFPFTETSPIIFTASGSYPDTQQYSEDITGLEEDNSYDISIAVSNMEGDSPFSPVSTQMTLEDVPDAPPTNIVLMALSSTTMQVSFGPPPSANRNGDILSYKIYYTGSPFDTSTVTLNVTGSIDPEESYLEDINSLQEFNAYNVTLAAVNAQGVGVASAPLSAQTFADVPLAAQDLMLSVLNATSIQVDFSPPLPEEQNGLITSYTIQYIGLNVDTMQDDDTTSITDTTYPASDQISYILTQLEEFEDYTITVFPVNSAGISFDPLSESAITLSAVPDSAPINVNIIPDQRSLTVTWDPPPAISQNGQISNYLIAITGDPFPFTETSPIIITASGSYPDTQQYSEDITGLEEYNSYDISIAASNMIGDGPFSPVSTQMTLEAAPTGAAQNVSINSVTSNSFNISFLQPIGQLQNGPILRYDVLYTGVTFQTNSLLQSFFVTAMDPTLISSEILVTLSNLQEFNDYNIQVRAVNSEGSAPLTMAIPGSTSEAAPDMAPIPTQIAQVNATSIFVAWQPPPGISQNGQIVSYTFYITGYPFFYTDTPPVVLATGGYPDTQSYSINITGLEEFNMYNLSIIAENSAGSSPPSDYITETTLEAVPGRPRLIGVLVLNATTIRVVWRAPLPADQNGIILEYNITLLPVSDLPPPALVTVAKGGSYPVPDTVLYEEEVTGLEEGFAYDIFVTAVTSIGPGLPSLSVRREMTPDIAPPNLPPFDSSAVNVTSVSSTSFGLSLPSVSALFLGGAHTGFTFKHQGYITIESLFSISQKKRSVDHLYTTDQITIVTEMGNDFLITGLLPHFNYIISVSANNAAGTSGAVYLADILLNSDVPSSPPINITAVTTSYSTINYTWDNNLTTINGFLLSYSLYYSESGEPAIKIPFEVNTLGPYTFVLDGLAPNTLYSFFIAVVNEIGDGPNSTLVWATTHPKVPESTIQPFPNTDSPPIESQGSIQIRVPTQNSFPTANIAAIYIISDMNIPPLFTLLSAMDAYSLINSETEPNIRIQAVLDSEYWNGEGTYFQFTIGDNIETSYNGNLYINMPLQAGTNYELSYYILFYDENEDITPEFSTIGSLGDITTAAFNTRFCVECVVFPIVVVLLLLLILCIIVLLLLFLCYWYKQRTALQGAVHTRNSPIRQVQLQRMEKSIPDKEQNEMFIAEHAKEDLGADSLEKKPL
ncbi:Phosphatidylinositol phosphatase PTPRQ-like isoform X2 [Oopsacas minuta]|uniref:Phosphatidylinositol phosphatase PTPRQ-like isoform X2 n=1 Tax=Oopsacas minuta TaxID=111878 RepID=A0AAV7JLH3_9METZ|nr:Phosphatidylinositol phosphatase PTPRQ-like isoform X2 [Oopsacas minuta]